MMGIGILTQGATAIYDGSTNQKLRIEYQIAHEQRQTLEKQLHLYESRLECIQNPQECGPTQMINVQIAPNLEVRTETDNEL